MTSEKNRNMLKKHGHYSLVFLGSLIFAFSLSAYGASTKVTRLSCDAAITDTYSNGSQEKHRERFTLEIETFPNGFMLFSAETPNVFISIPSRGKKGRVDVVDNSNEEVWRFNTSSEIKGRKSTQSIRLDRVTGELYYSSSYVLRSEISGNCEKLSNNQRQF